MKMSKMIAAVALLSMASTPALAASANPAASLSVAKTVRASAPAKGASRLADGPSTITAVFFGALAIGGIVALATSDDDSDSN